MSNMQHWDKRQIREFVKSAKSRAGAGWTLLGPDLQEALVLREACYVILLQHQADKYAPAVELIQGMLDEMVPK